MVVNGVGYCFPYSSVSKTEPVRGKKLQKVSLSKNVMFLTTVSILR